MYYIRLLHPRNYSVKHAKFSSQCFEFSSTDGGISVFEQDCSEGVSQTICQHIQEYYGDVTGRPATFWIFDSSILPSQCSIVQKDSLTGDTCHHNVLGFARKNDAKKFFKVHFDTMRDTLICTAENLHETITQQQIDSIILEYFPQPDF